MTYKEILPGVKLRVIETDRFETNCLSVQFKSKMSEDTASMITLVPRILRRGTAKHPDMESLAAALDEMYGARIEAVSRKYGDVIGSGFICDFVESEEKLLPDVAELLGEIAFDAKTEHGAFRRDYVDGERANLIDEIKTEINSKLNYAYRRASERVLQGTPFAVSELGTEEAAERADENSLFKYYKKVIAEFPCEVFFCGNYSADEVEREIKKMFTRVKRRFNGGIESEKPVYTESGRVCEKMDVSQANLLVGLYNENADVYTAKLFSAILGGGTTSKLFVNVREKNSLCYFTGSVYDSFKNTLFMYCGIDPKNEKKAEKAMTEQLSACVAGDITDEEIKNARKGMLDDLATIDDSPFSQEGFWLRAAVSGDERTPEELSLKVKKISADDIISCAKGFKRAITYLLTGLEGSTDETKLLPRA